MISRGEALSKEQVFQYHQQGWLGSFTLSSEFEMGEVRDRIDREILEPERLAQLHEKVFFHNCHLDNRCIYELISPPNFAIPPATNVSQNTLPARPPVCK